MASSASATRSVPGATGSSLRDRNRPVARDLRHQVLGKCHEFLQVQDVEVGVCEGDRLQVLDVMGPGGELVATGDRRRVPLDALQLVDDSEAERAEREDRPSKPGRQALRGIEDRIAALRPEQLREGDDGGVALRDGGFGGERVRPVEDAHQHVGDDDDGHKLPASAGAETRARAREAEQRRLR